MDYDEIIMKGVGVLFLLAIVGLMLGLISLGVASIHDAIYAEKEFKSEFLILDDVQYMDEGKILYRFGDIVIKDILIKDNFNVNEMYEVVYIRYKDAWLHESNKWDYHKIKILEDATKRTKEE